ncbi:aminoglycoside phosphotransferase family protein [Pseudoruegeria sp. HB172150]|uniref:aminoglycoside phosphotransferase family protein n=1 Tax=Pseudoruegeria sp. HB172150 TaxID=2721164 RepID=UPI00155509C2
MHSDQIHIDHGLVSALLRQQVPALADRPLRRLNTGGTENALFRLGESHAVRLPIRPGAADSMAREIRWLPHLVPHLPLASPGLVHAGTATDAYPYPWIVQHWLPGDDAATTPPDDLTAAADTLAGLIRALHAIPVPVPAPSGGRGGPLVTRDEPFAAALTQSTGLTDTERAAAHWQAARAVPAWQGAPVWIHGDLIPANLLVRDGRIAGLLDFGAMGVGDPAYDLIPAWFVLDAAARRRFRAITETDDATWIRARGLVVSQSIIALPYYLNTNPTMVALARRGLTEALPEPV